MIEIELFQNEPSCGMHTIKVWVNSNLVYVSNAYPASELQGLRDALQNELHWINAYLKEMEVDK